MGQFYLFTPMHQKGISKLEGGLILNPYREITGGNRAINMLIRDRPLIRTVFSICVKSKYSMTHPPTPLFA